jgi:D-glycero-D-manno-heptose 1,7-bisphosphate phosphatase
MQDGQNGRRGAVIFDRDGVLNVDVDYGYRPDQIVWIPGAREAVKAVNDAGLYAFVATNQSGVARGYFSEEDVHALHAWMNARLAETGARIDAFEHSPFHPDGVVEAYRRASDCRKPGPGMILRLLERFPADPARTVMIGDRASDVEAAQAAGIEGVLFEGGDLFEVVLPIVERLKG